MQTIIRKATLATTLAAAFIVAACATQGTTMTQGTTTMPAGEKITLEGRNEVPAVNTTAVGSANVEIHADRSVKVKVIVSGITPTAAHIHEGAVGANGPVVVPLNKLGDNEFIAADGAKLTDAQYAAYKAGNLYVNVHSAKHPSGEIRGQLSGR
jgi:hypothetical protein